MDTYTRWRWRYIDPATGSEARTCDAATMQEARALVPAGMEPLGWIAEVHLVDMKPRDRASQPAHAQQAGQAHVQETEDEQDWSADQQHQFAAWLLAEVLARYELPPEPGRQPRTAGSLPQGKEAGLAADSGMPLSLWAWLRRLLGR